MGDILPYWLSVMRPAILAASLPILVLYLAELVSDDKQYHVKVAEREAKKEAKKATKKVTNNQPVKNIAPIDKARQAKHDKISKRQDLVLSFLNDGMTEADIADKLNVSVRTVQRDVKNLNGKAA